MVDRNSFIRSLWLAKVRGLITAEFYLIARAMLRQASKGGRLWPSRAYLAAAVGCSERTVLRAHQRLAELGFVCWEARHHKWNRRAANLYTLTIPEHLPDSRPRRSKKGRKEDTSFDSSSDKLSVGSETAETAGKILSAADLPQCEPPRKASVIAPTPGGPVENLLVRNQQRFEARQRAEQAAKYAARQGLDPGGGQVSP